MPFPFRRKSSNLVEDALHASDPAAAPTTSATTDATATASAAGSGGGDATAADRQVAPTQRKARTPSKREQGKVTPKRVSAGRRAPEPPPASRREAYRRMREQRRVERKERMEGLAAGDARFMLNRDKGPERALVRDIVDYRLTVGTWFFAGALIILVGSSAAMPLEIRFASNILWIILATATTIDSVLICRRIKKMIRARFPKTQQKLGSLYFYAIMRAITFRRMRMPRPRIKLGEEF